MTSTLAAQQRASRTAYDCAATRAAVFAATRLPSFDYLAHEVGDSPSASRRARLGLALLRFGAHGLVRRLIARASPGADVFLFARQMVADDLIRDALAAGPETQAVILGAGLDTSGVRIGAERRAAGLSPGTFFEVDLPAMQEEKRRIAVRLAGSGRYDDAHVAYVPCSFGEGELTSALRAAGFDPARPSVWVWSGVIHYLTEAAVRETLTDLRALSAPGSQLCFDFILLEAYERPAAYGFAETKRRFDAFGEVMSFGFREGTDHVREWLAAQGITLAGTLTNLDMVKLYEARIGRPASSRGTPWANLAVASM